MSKRTIPKRATCACGKTCTCTDDEKEAEKALEREKREREKLEREEQEREAQEKREREEHEREEMETNFKQAMTDVHELNKRIDYNTQPNVIYTIINTFIQDFTNKYNKFNKTIMTKIQNLNNFTNIDGLINNINNIYETILWSYILYENKISIQNIQYSTPNERKMVAKKLAKQNTRWVD